MPLFIRLCSFLQILFLFSNFVKKFHKYFSIWKYFHFFSKTCSKIKKSLKFLKMFTFYFILKFRKCSQISENLPVLRNCSLTKKSKKNLSLFFSGNWIKYSHFENFVNFFRKMFGFFLKMFCFSKFLHKFNKISCFIFCLQTERNVCENIIKYSRFEKIIQNFRKC